MAEAATPAPEPVANVGSPKRVLMVLIVGNAGLLDDILTGLLDMGAPGTVVEARGLMSLLREEMPIFSGLAAMLPETSGSRVVLSFTTSDVVEQVFVFLTNEIEQKNRPIAFTLPVDAVLGDQSEASPAAAEPGPGGG
ncbi:MAG: hypothetical protein KDA20_05515 [Phycisphaerales bacterium]|nr:hypothetical protein [Phycisphaerales bacterium]